VPTRRAHGRTRRTPQEVFPDQRRRPPRHSAKSQGNSPDGARTRRRGGDAVRPPAVALWILEHFVPESMREGIIGDLVEHFHRDIVPRRSRAAAWLWFWREALRAPIALPVRDPSTGDGLMS